MSRDDPPDNQHAAAAPTRRRLWPWALLTAPLALFIGALWLDSGGGQRWLLAMLSRQSTDTGLSVRIGRVEGSLYNRARLYDVEMRDQRGVFAKLDRADMIWRPLALLRQAVMIDQLAIESGSLRRLPELRTPRPDQPLLPDYDLDIRDVRLSGVRVDPAVTGQPLTLAGAGTLRLRRHDVDARLALAAREGPDRFDAQLTADPDLGRFVLAADIEAPRGGVLQRLAGLPDGLRLRATGEGRYSGWRGQLDAELGGQALANLNLRFADGALEAAGQLAAAPALRPAWQAVLRTMPGLQARVAIANRSADATMSLRGDSARAEGEAKINANNGRLETGLLRLSDPRCALGAALLPGLDCAGLSGELRGAGPVRHPGFSARLTADRAGRGGWTGERLLAQLANRPEPGQPFDVTVSAANVSGGDTGLGGYGENLAGTAELVREPDAWRFAPARLTSTRLSLAGDVTVPRDGGGGRFLLSQGRILWAEGGLAGLPVSVTGTGSWLADKPVVADLRVVPDAAAWQSAVPETQRLLALVSAASGRLVMTGERADWTGLVLETRAGRFTGRLAASGGQLDGQLRGTLSRWEALAPTLAGSAPLPLDLAVTGPATAPRLSATGRLAMLETGVMTFTNLTGTVTPGADGRNAARLTGSSPYGPVALSGTLTLASGAVDLSAVSGAIGRYRLSGGVAQSRAGPWRGQLRVAAPNPAQLSGTADLLALAGDAQGIRLDLRGRGLTERWNGAPVSIGAFGVRGAGRLGTAWTWSGVVGVDALRQGRLQLDRLRWSGALGAGTGRSAWRLSGRHGQPFQLAGNLASFGTARLEQLRITGGGSIGGEPVTLAAPAQILRRADGWQLAPASVRWGAGTLSADALWRGPVTTLNLSSRLLSAEAFDLLRPNTNLSGRVTGRANLQWTRGLLAAAEGAATVQRLRQLGPAAPGFAGLDADVRGQLVRQGLSLTAVPSVGGRSAGELQLLVQRGPDQRFDSGTVRGRLRWSGPAEALTALLQPVGTEVGGELVLDTSLAGLLRSPVLAGSFRLERGRWTPIGGLPLTDVRGAGRVSGVQARFDRFEAAAPGGAKLSGTASVDLLPARGFPARLDAQVTGLPLLRDMTASGTLRASSSLSGSQLGGELLLSGARLRVGLAPPPPPRLRSRRAPAPATPAQSSFGWTLPPNLALDLSITVADRLLFEAPGINAEWTGALRLLGSGEEPRLAGQLRLQRGTLQFGRTRMALTGGTALFDGGARLNPLLDLQASSKVRSGMAGLTLVGPALTPRLRFTHTPDIGDQAILARLLYDDLPRSVSKDGLARIDAALVLAKQPGATPNFANVETDMARPFAWVQQVAATGRPPRR
jgi:translocation and assembly module TamB